MCVFFTLYKTAFRLREFGNKILLAGVLFSLSLAAYGLLVGAVIIYFHPNEKNYLDYYIWKSFLLQLV